MSTLYCKRCYKVFDDSELQVVQQKPKDLELCPNCGSECHAELSKLKIITNTMWTLEDALNDGFLNASFMDNAIDVTDEVKSWVAVALQQVLAKALMTTPDAFTLTDFAADAGANPTCYAMFKNSVGTEFEFNRIYISNSVNQEILQSTLNVYI